MQPTYKRQRFLLAFIRHLRDHVTITELQKLVFLHSMAEGLDLYEFTPYKFGPYSFQIAEDIDILRRDGYLTADASTIQAVEGYSIETVFRTIHERGDDLIRKAYREYPFYALNSEIINRLFQDKEAERFIQNRERYKQTGQVLFTIGYEGKSIERFMNILIQNDVRLLCDVRKNPLSRKFGFSRGKLKHIAENVGIRYVHVPDLGIDSSKRSSLDSVEDYQSLFRDYARSLSTLEPQLESLYSLLCSNTRIALMCFEREPEMCHRHVIRDYLTTLHTMRSVDL